MPLIKVWCLPKTGERKLNQLFKAIVQAVASVTELGLKDEKSMTVLFPLDMMKYGLGTEIIVEVTGLFVKNERTLDVRQHLAANLGTTLKQFFPKTEKVECLVYTFNPMLEGFWSSDIKLPRMGRRHKPTSDELYPSQRGGKFPPNHVDGDSIGG
jgi:phenylpyruvate tautomerase PptA (4-oxalocrotonate tautomerase family)